MKFARFSRQVIFASLLTCPLSPAFAIDLRSLFGVKKPASGAAPKVLPAAAVSAEPRCEEATSPAALTTQAAHPTSAGDSLTLGSWQQALQELDGALKPSLKLPTQRQSEIFVDHETLLKQADQMITEVARAAQEQPLLHDLAQALSEALKLTAGYVPSASQGKTLWQEIQRLRFLLPNEQAGPINSLENAVAQIYYHWISYGYADLSNKARPNFAFSLEGNRYRRGAWMKLFWAKGEGYGLSESDGMFNVRQLSRVNPLWLAAAAKLAQTRLTGASPGSQLKQKYPSRMAVRLNVDWQDPYNISARVDSFRISANDGVSAEYERNNQTGTATPNQRIDLGNLASALLPPRLFAWTGLKENPQHFESTSRQGNWSLELSGAGPAVLRWLTEQKKSRATQEASAGDNDPSGAELPLVTAASSEQTLARSKRADEMRLRENDLATLLRSLKKPAHFRFANEGDFHPRENLNSQVLNSYTSTRKELLRLAGENFEERFGSDRQKVLSDGDYLVSMLDTIRQRMKSPGNKFSLSDRTRTIFTLNYLLSEVILSPYLKTELQFALLEEFLDEFQDLEMGMRGFHNADDADSNFSELRSMGRFQPVLEYIHALRWVESALDDSYWIRGQKLRLALYQQALKLDDRHALETLEPDTLLYDLSRITSGAHPRLRDSASQTAFIKAVLDGHLLAKESELELLSEPIFLDMIFTQLQRAESTTASGVAEDLLRLFVESTFTAKHAVAESKKVSLQARLKHALVSPALRTRLDLAFIDQLANEIPAFGSWLDRIAAE